MSVEELLKAPIIVGDLTTPTCGQMDCDIVENPTHWVSTELTPQAQQALKAFPFMLQALKSNRPTVPNGDYKKAMAEANRVLTI